MQSFMDYGSEICIPRNPKCEICGIKEVFFVNHIKKFTTKNSY